LTTSLKKELNAEQGVVVSCVEEDSPADDAGIMEEDVILEVDGKKVKTPATLSRVVRKIKPGTEVKIVLLRDGKQESLKVKIGKIKRQHSCSIIKFGDPFIFSNCSPFIGVALQELNKDLAEYFGVKYNEGALIIEIVDDSPAEKSGLKAGDVIIKVEDDDIAEPADVKELVAQFEEGDEIAIEVLRHKKKKVFKVVLEEDENSAHHININRLPKLKRLEEKIDLYNNDFKKIETKLLKKFDDAI